MNKVKTIKIKNEDGSISEESYSIAADAINIDMVNDKNVQETIGTIDVDADGDIATQLKNKINKNDIIDNLNSSDNNKVLSAKQGKMLNEAVAAANLDIKKKVYYFNNVADMKAADLQAGDVVQTLGYYEANDGGEGLYKIVNDNTLVDDGGSVHNLTNGLKATLIIDDVVNPAVFGAKGDGITDDCTPFQKAFNVSKNIRLSNKKSYLLSSSIINVTNDTNTTQIISLDLNSSTLLDASFSFNMNEALSDWKYSYTTLSFLVKNGNIGNWNKSRNGQKDCVFLTGSHLILENINVYRTPHLIALAQEFIDYLTLKNVYCNFYNTEVNEFKNLDFINVINKSNGNIQKISSSIHPQGDGWKLNVHECHTQIVEDYALIRIFANNCIVFDQCVQSKIIIGDHINALFSGCHFESVNTPPELADTAHWDSKITFLNCGFINNYEFLDFPFISYDNCKFNVGIGSSLSFTDILKKPINAYYCKFKNCTTTYVGQLLDSDLYQTIWNTPINCLLSDYYLTDLKNSLDQISFTEISSSNYDGTPVGNYSFKIFYHINNDLSKYYKSVEGTFAKNSLNSYMRSNYKIKGSSYILEIYITFPDGGIRRCVLKSLPLAKQITNYSSSDNSTTLRIIFYNGAFAINTENPGFEIIEPLITVDSIPSKTQSNNISKY